MASLNSPNTITYAKDWRRLDKIASRERETYELVTTNMSNTDPHTRTEPVPQSNTTLVSTDRAFRVEGTREPPARDAVQDHLANTDFPPSPPDDFLALFFSRLPQELRDLVYTFVHKQDCWAHQITKDIIIQPPYLFLFNARTTPSMVSPYSPIPPHLCLSLPPPSRLLVRLVYEIAACFFTMHSFWARYRYTAALHTFLSTPFGSSGVVPGDCVRRLGVLLGPPESAEDSWRLDDEESEYPWEAIFPVPRNGKCGMWGRQLDVDFERLGRVFGRGGEGWGGREKENKSWEREACDFKVYLMDGYSDEVSGVEAWLRRWAQGVNVRGGRVSTSRMR